MTWKRGVLRSESPLFSKDQLYCASPSSQNSPPEDLGARSRGRGGILSTMALQVDLHLADRTHLSRAK